MNTLKAQSAVYFKGYVTTYAAIAGKSIQELEKTLGFHIGSLNSGYKVFELSEPVFKNDFEWKDRTAYSDGWHWDPTINEYVQRWDEFRAHLGRANDYDEAATDSQLNQFMEEQLRLLNVRSGGGRIVKLVPGGRVPAFPDSPFRNVPQWKLTIVKRFSPAL